MKKLLSTLLLLVILTPILASCGYSYIEPGQVGIKIDKLGSEREITASDVVVGRVFYNSWATGVVKYPVSVQRIEWWGEDALAFNSTEAVRLKADIALSMYVDPSKVPALYTKYRRTLDEMIDNEIRDRTNGCLTTAASDMTVDQIIGSERDELLAKARACVEARLTPEGFIVNDLLLTSPIDPPETIRATIDAKIAAEQNAIAARNKVEQSRAEADQQIEAARGRAESRLLEAQAEAEATRVVGQALAENPQVLQLRYLETWDGVLPSTLAGEGMELLLPVR